jgi:hypothetical protein
METEPAYIWVVLPDGTQQLRVALPSSSAAEVSLPRAARELRGAPGGSGLATPVNPTEAFSVFT